MFKIPVPFLEGQLVQLTMNVYTNLIRSVPLQLQDAATSGAIIERT